MSSTISAREYAKVLRQAKDLSARRVVIALNKVGRSWLEEIQAQEPSQTGELTEAFYLVRASHGNLKIEIRNDLEYADYVEDGFMQKEHWVPGHWEGNRFVYVPGEKSGMKVENEWVKGNHVVRNARMNAEAELRARLQKIVFGRQGG